MKYIRLMKEFLEPPRYLVLGSLKWVKSPLEINYYCLLFGALEIEILLYKGKVVMQDMLLTRGGTQLFFGGCVPHGFPKVGSREWIFLQKWGVLGMKIQKICILRAEILTKTRLKIENFSKIWKWGALERCNDGKLVG